MAKPCDKNCVFFHIWNCSSLVHHSNFLKADGSSFVFVCLGFFVPFENFSLIWRCDHFRLRAANFDLWSPLMAIDQWGFFSVPHLLWHGASIYNGQLRVPVTLTPIARRLTVGLSLPVVSYVLAVSVAFLELVPSSLSLN